MADVKISAPDRSLGLLRIPRPLRFVFVGASGMFVDLACYSFLLLLMPSPVARAVAIFVAMTWNFSLNRSLTFADRDNRRIFRQYASYFIACSLGATISWSISVGLSEGVSFFARAKLLAAGIGILAATGFNYALCCSLVFRRHRPAGSTLPETLQSGSPEQ